MSSNQQPLSQKDSSLQQQASSSLSPVLGSSENTDSGGGDLPKLPGRGSRNLISHKSAPKILSFDGAQGMDHPLLMGTKWKIWKGVTAIAKAQGSAPDKTVGEVNGFYLIQDGEDREPASFDIDKPIVVMNPAAKTVGVMTGTVAVTLQSDASPDFLTESGQVKIIGAFPQIQTYYVTSEQNPFDLAAFYQELKKLPEVKDVQLEILDRQYEKF